MAVKELLQLRRDRSSLSVILLVPAFLLVMFGYAISLDVKHVSLAVLDHDRSPESRALARAFTVTEFFSPRRPPRGAPHDVDALLATEQARAAIVIPRGYGSDRAALRPVAVQVIIDGANASAGAAVLGYVSGIAEAHAGRRPGRGPGPLIELRPRIFYNPELSSPVYLVPGLVTLILMITGAITTALAVVREKERGTMEQILVSPLRPFELILGKTLPYMLVSLASAGAIFTAGVLLFDVPVRGSLLDLLLVTVVFLAACIGMGLLISSVSATQQSAFLIAVIATLLPSFVLSGFVFPIRNMPPPVRLLTLPDAVALLPGRHARRSCSRGRGSRSGGISSPASPPLRPRSWPSRARCMRRRRL